MDYIKLEYAAALAFLKRIGRTVLLTTAMFFIAGIAGHFIFTALYESEPAQLENHRQILFSMMQSKDLLSESGQISATALFFNNFVAAGMAVVLGVVPFLFVSIGALGVNAAILGMLSAMMAQETHDSLYQMVVSIAPHGIFELPALFIAGGMGLMLCLDISARIIYRRRPMPFLTLLCEMLRLFVLVVIPLLVVAAVVEAYLTPVVMQLLL